MADKKITTKALLKRLETWLSQNRTEAFETMNQGLGKTSLAAFETQLSVKLPSSVKQYFSWRDGQNSDTYECIPPDEWEFLPSFLVIRIKAQMDKDYQGSSPDGSLDLQTWWRPSFIPFLCDPSGGYMCLDSTGSTGKKWQIVEFKHDTNDLVIRHESFEKWLETTVRTLEAELYENGEIADNKTYQQLYQEINPGFPATIKASYRS
jgi:cell wall assembly regulator SMI1